MNKPRPFKCDCCHEIYFTLKPYDKAMDEHKKRLVDIDGYSQGEEIDNDTGLVCDYCFKAIMAGEHPEYLEN